MRSNRGLALTMGALAAAGLTACETSPVGLLPTPKNGTGPAVVFDLLARPLPEIPFPNDMATRLDVDSPTGRRVNASLVAPTYLEIDVRKEFSLLDGWGTFAPITVSFEQPVDPRAMYEAHLNDTFEDDAVYLVNLKTGEPVMLDLGRGNFPVVLQNNDKYFPNDPRGMSSNLLFETYAEEDLNGNGILEPEEDTDHDGVWDRPNTWNPDAPQRGLANPAEPRATNPAEKGNHAYHDLISFYERETNTLIVRPVVALAQRTPYAVVLTGRIKGEDGKPIRSPFPFVNHAAQTEQLRPLLKWIDSGKVPGLARDDVAFAWAFTTQSVTTDLEAIRDGLHGKGPLASLASRVSDRLEPVLFWNEDADVGKELETHPVHPVRRKSVTGPEVDNPYIVPLKDFEPALRLLAPVMEIEDEADVDYLLDGYKFVDYFVIGSFKTADFLDDPVKPTFDAVFRVNPEQGLARVWARPEDWAQREAEALEAAANYALDANTAHLRQAAKRATRDRVYFMLAVPRALNGHKAPFPTAIYGHGYTSARVEMLGFAGNLAKYGIASVAIDSYGHGLDLDKNLRHTIESIVKGQVKDYDFSPLVESIFKGRARDLDHDLMDNSGGDFWVADTFHTRDIVRQSIVDWIQLIRVFHAFGTYKIQMGDKEVWAGDFNGDGVPDVGGPERPTQEWWETTLARKGKRNGGYDFFAWGQSLGGILAGILPAVEPSVAAAAPVAGGAGLSDIGIRSEQGGVIQAVFLEIMGPLIVGTPAEGGVHLDYVVQDVNTERRVRLTEMPLDIREGDRVYAENPFTKGGEEMKTDFAIAGPDGRFRLQVAADNASFADDAPLFELAGADEANKPAPLEVRLGACEPTGVKAAEKKRLKMLHHADCIVFKRSRPGAVDLVVDTFQRDIVFQGRLFKKGTPWVALARGFAMKRGAPTFRRFMSLAQTILEPGDPGNYANHYWKDLLKAREGNPTSVLIVGTTGDLNVPVNTAYSQGRIAGVVPYVYDPQKHAKWGMSPNDVLIRSKATEALEKLEYFRPVAQQMREPGTAVDPDDQDIVNLVMCTQPEHCEAQRLVDPGLYAWDAESGTFLDEDNHIVRNRGAPRLKHSLRDVMEVSYEGIGADGSKITKKTAMITPYLEDTGKHGFDVAHPADKFDIDLFMINMIGRFFETRGADLRYDVCMHRDGYTDRRLLPDGTRNTAAKRVTTGCEFIPDYPAGY